MTGAHQEERLSRGHVVSMAVVLAVIAGLVIVACAELAAGHWLTGGTALASAALGGFAALFIELNRALTELNRALIDQNARLLHAAGEDTLTFRAQREDRPGPRRRRGPSRADRQIALARLHEALGRAEENRGSEDEDAG